MPDAQPVLMPKFGQKIEDCTLVAWRKKVGDKVKRGEIMFEIETDKATLEVESFQEGTLLKILVKDGEVAQVQTPVAFIGNAGDNIPDVRTLAPPPALAPSEAAQPPAMKPDAAERADTAPAVLAPVSKPVPATAPVSSRRKMSPRAAKLAGGKAIDPGKITGTGPGGRVVEKDVVAYLKDSGYDSIRVTPSALKLACREKIDILELAGGARVTMDDIKRAVAEKPKPMSRMRQVIAQRLTESFTSTPHFFVTVAVDMTDLLVLRQKAIKKGAEYSVTDFIMRAVVLSLKEFPDVNSSTDGASIRWHGRVHLGLAVSLDNGLVVPVIRNADELSLRELHSAAADLVARAREGKLGPAEMQGSTFTISNMGMLNVENFTAIINPGESAILAVSTTSEVPVVRKGRVVARSMMKITLSGDHRIIDGATAARFANAVRTKLEDISLWRSLI